MVPIVEPDIDVVQGDHTIEKAAQVSEKVLAAFFKVLQAQLDIFTKKHLILGLCRNFSLFVCNLGDLTIKPYFTYRSSWLSPN